VFGGRRKLLDAALSLAVQSRSLSSIGIREIARRAGLNPNTFYRHFESLDELGLALVEELGSELRTGLSAIRTALLAGGPVRLGAVGHNSGITGEMVVRQSLTLVLDFVLKHEVAYIVGLRELHGGSPVLRRALRALIDSIAADIATDILRVIPPGLVEEATVHDLAAVIARQVSVLGLEYLEHREQREEFKRQAEHFILLLFYGALAERNYRQASVEVTPKPQAPSKRHTPTSTR